ncbi:MAG: phosphoenolpyruvate synthase [Syntrophus sp. (in: bacteria)]|nr:phosphoenolpyruvate synthase [Syntrophus sp. (in: bacteria)]
MKLSVRASTGLDNLDSVVDGLRTGDNVVWQVDNIDDYGYFAAHFVRRAVKDGKRVVYMRFAHHKRLIDPDVRIVEHELNARSGFESFSTQVHSILTREGEGGYYIFDSLSDLQSAWATDLMVGNFFRITCPYLFQLNTIAYFGLLRNGHSFKTVARIRETTQVLLDIYNTGSDLYVHPLKVRGRHSSTMFLPHKREGERFIPLTSSVDATRLLTCITGRETEHAKRNLDYWDRLFLNAEELLHMKGQATEKGRVLDRLCRIMIGREKRIRTLAKETFSLEDLLLIKARLIGTGYIGGKAAGMLIARKILDRDKSFVWADFLEPHDSFFIGSDVFYTFIVENGLWKLRMEQKTREGYFEKAPLLREQMRAGSLPEEIEEQFWQVIEYFGQSPIIVRSSSLLEDAFGNAFAGKYESIFCVNQGTPEQRYKQFSECVRQIYASTMSEDALTYRLKRGLDKQDEQMALLVQRVSGSYRNHYFFPDLAGVGISHNTFVWKEDMDQKAGMIRLVLGLGTRAVNRTENDYPRIVALDAPLLKPHAGMGDTRRYSQHDGDVLNIEENKLETISVDALMTEKMGIPRDLLGVRDFDAAAHLKERGMKEREVWTLTFDAFLSETPFPGIMQAMLKRLELVYHYPVDIEFTVNFTGPTAFQINLVQCRPLQTKGEGKSVEIPADVAPDRVLFQSKGAFMGGNVIQPVRRIIYIEPDEYSRLPLSEKYDIARLIGKLNRLITNKGRCPAMLMGPGRWGTSTPSLGVPVRFSEISNISVIVEIEHANGSLMPELSFGTHFFQDLVETDIFYVALFPGREHVAFNLSWIQKMKNELPSEFPEGRRYEHVVKVWNIEEERLYLMADIVTQMVLCFNPSKTDQ